MTPELVTRMAAHIRATAAALKNEAYPSTNPFEIEVMEIAALLPPAIDEPSLLQCPFCGGRVMFRKALWPSDGCTDAIIHAGPNECALIEFGDGSIDESILAKWNTRGTPDASPTDPILLEARRLIAHGHPWSERILAGECDAWPEITGAMLGLRRGMEMGGGE